MVISFVTCIRLFALSRNQEDCTPLEIKNLIKNDYFKHNVIEKHADIDMCISGMSFENTVDSRYFKFQGTL